MRPRTPLSDVTESTRLRRRSFLQGFVGLASAAGLALLTGCGPEPSTARPPARVARVGVLGSGTARTMAEAANYVALGESLRELGWIEGQNVAFDVRSSNGDNARLPSLVADLLSLPIDVIVTGNATAAQTAQRATSTVPIVLTGVAEPVSLGLAESLAHPGGNVTGLTRIVAQLVAKRLELLKEVLPNLARFAALWDLTPGAELQVNETQAAAPRLALQVQVVPVKTLDDFEAAVSAASRGRAEALTLHGPLFGSPVSSARRIGDLAVRAGLPSVAVERQYVEAGVFMSYGENVVEIHRRAATYVDKILRGARVAEMPIEQSPLELVINLTTAEALGLTIPPLVASRVNEWVR